jgi:excisionase family DNA binding protein
MPDLASSLGVPTDGVAAKPGVLTAAEVARELRCSKAHVHNLINGKVDGARPLPSLWLGRRRLVRRSSLDQWIAANEHGLVL